MERIIPNAALSVAPKIETVDFPDGKRIVRRYEHNVLVSELHIQMFPSGKQTHLDFDGHRNLTREIHFYGALKISLMSEFHNGKKTEETYFVNKRLASRRTYEKARSKYSDMPPADAAFQDFAADLFSLAAARRKAWTTASKTHVPDSDNARKMDGFCLQLIKSGLCSDAKTWIKSSKNTLGEVDHQASQRLVDGLIRLGASRIFACDIDDYGEKGQNTGHLIVELPRDKTLRCKLLKKVAQLADKKGFAGDFDDGQKYAYIKLD